jgi:hypothetical protein
MFIPFDQLPEQSRIWIYQADRPLEVSEIETIDFALRYFTQNWEAHQHPLQASYQILYHRFIILAVNQDHYPPSGCSIDKSVAVIRHIEQEFGLKLFDRLTVAYWENGQIKTTKNKELKDKIEKGEFLPETLVFNNTLQSKADLELHWQVPAHQTWLAKYFKQEVSA